VPDTKAREIEALQLGRTYKRRSFLIQGVSDEIQFLAGNIEHFLD
jgi:hypothetical protein